MQMKRTKNYTHSILTIDPIVEDGKKLHKKFMTDYINVTNIICQIGKKDLLII